MADPFSLTASIITVLDLSGKVVQYLNSVKDASKDRSRIRDEITSASFLLYMIKDHAKQASSGDNWLPTLVSLCHQQGPLEQFKKCLEKLAASLAPRKGWGERIECALKWPFKKEDVTDLLTVIERQKSLFNLALQNDHV